MPNYDTVKAITDNIETVLKKLGANFVRKTFEDLKDVPASLLPLGQIFYEGEVPDDTFNERPSYMEAEFRLRVVLGEPTPQDMMRSQQKWTHLMRGALTVAALNIGALASSKLISRVELRKFDTDNSRTDGIATINCAAIIRYRET